MFKEEVFNKIFDKSTKGEEYCFIDNGYKTWIIPYDNMRYGNDMFSSYSLNGYMIKHIFPKLKWNKTARKKAGCKVTYMGLNKDITDIIEQYIDKPYQCAVYYGNLDTEQNYKATIQVFSKKETLLYIKISNTPVVKRAFQKEISQVLELSKKGIGELPQMIAVEQSDEWDILVQKPQSVKSKKCKTFGQNQWDFLEKLYEETAVSCDYELTDLYEYIKYLSDFTKNNDFYKKDIIKKAFECAYDYLKNINQFSFAHGDFTPWNMAEIKNGLYVYDFEYCMRLTVPYIDYFHFICQKEMIKNRADINCVIKKFENDKKEIKRHIENPDIIFIIYLMYIISFYIKRNNGSIRIKSGHFLFRIALLEELLKKI